MQKKTKALKKYDLIRSIISEAKLRDLVDCSAELHHQRDGSITVNFGPVFNISSVGVVNVQHGN